MVFFCPSKPSLNLETNPHSSQNYLLDLPHHPSCHILAQLFLHSELSRHMFSSENKLSSFLAQGLLILCSQERKLFPQSFICGAVCSHLLRNILPDDLALIWSLELFSRSSSFSELILIHNNAFPFCQYVVLSVSSTGWNCAKAGTMLVFSLWYRWNRTECLEHNEYAIKV